MARRTFLKLRQETGKPVLLGMVIAVAAAMSYASSQVMARQLVTESVAPLVLSFLSMAFGVGFFAVQGTREFRKDRSASSVEPSLSWPSPERPAQPPVSNHLYRTELRAGCHRQPRDRRKPSHLRLPGPPLSGAIGEGYPATVDRRRDGGSRHCSYHPEQCVTQ